MNSILNTLGSKLETFIFLFIHFHYVYIIVLLEMNENKRKWRKMYEIKVLSLVPEFF